MSEAHAVFTDLIDMLERSVARYGSRKLFGTKQGGAWRWMTYAEFGAEVDAMRAGLASLGIGRDDAVAMVAGNRVEWAVCAYASYGLGARFVPMYESQQPKDWQYILRDSGARLLVTSTESIFEQMRPWAADAGVELRCMALPAGHESSLASLTEPPRPPVPSARIEPQDVCAFIYTSGTTGQPKGVLLTHNNLISNVNAIQAFIPWGGDDLTLSFLPWAHSFGQTAELHCLISVGAATAFAESVPKLVDNLVEVRPTVLVAVPRVFNKIYDGVKKRIAAEGGVKQRLFEAAIANAARRKALAERGKVDLRVEAKHRLFDRVVFSKVRARFGGRLRFAFSGGAALAPEVAEFIDNLGILVIEGYGLTETSPIACANRPDARRIGSVGLPIPGVEVRIDRSALDGEVDSETDGEILIKGPNVMKGYHGLPEATAAVMTADGAFRTGDRGRIDADGFVWITGRIKEQYKLENGKYVVPAPLEDQLQLAGEVAQAYVHGMNRPYNVALIVPDREAVESWARSHGVSEGWPQLLRSPAVHDHVGRALAAVSGGFKGYERVRKFALIADEFSVENGELTPKMSLKRRVVESRYATVIDGLYADEG